MQFSDNIRSLILYEDESLLAIDKPSGLLTIQDGYHPDLPHLAQILFPAYGKIWIVHRLDRETSGVILVARSVIAHRALNQQFEQRRVEKCYLAIVGGLLTQDEFSIETPLRVNGDRKHRTVPAPLIGKPAQTDFLVQERFQNACVVKAFPRTGYTHQIRAHLASIGHPILGDHLYESLRPNIEPLQEQVKHEGVEVISRVALHALSISFHHPLTDKNITITSPLPQDFQKALSLLRNP